MYGIRGDTADIKDLKEGVYDIRGNTADIKEQIKKLQEATSKNTIAYPVASTLGELYWFVSACLESFDDFRKQPNKVWR